MKFDVTFLQTQIIMHNATFEEATLETYIQAVSNLIIAKQVVWTVTMKM